MLNFLINFSKRTEQCAFGALVVLTVALAFNRDLLIFKGDYQTISTLEVLVFLAVGLWLSGRVLVSLNRALHNSRCPQCITYQPSIPRQLILPVLAWLVVLIISASRATVDSAVAFKMVFKISSSILIGWAIFDLAYSRDRLRFMIYGLAIGGMLAAVLGVLEAFGLTPVTHWLTNFNRSADQFAGLSRVSATLSHPNLFAHFLELTLPLMMVFMLTAQQRWLRWVVGLGFLCGLTALVLTLSRGGLFATVLGFGLMAAIAAWQEQWSVTYASLLTIGGLLTLMFLSVFNNPLLMVRFMSEGGNEQWYRALYEAPTQLEAEPAAELLIPLTLTNTGLQEWEVDSAKPFNLAYHISQVQTGYQVGDPVMPVAGDYVVYGGPRTFLPRNVSQNGAVEVMAQAVAPSTPGTYMIEWDMIQESVTWFSDKGAATGKTLLVVKGEKIATVTSKTQQDLPPADAQATAVRPASRLFIWKTALTMFRDHPLFGVGPSNYHLSYSSYELRSEVAPAPHAHSLYLGWLADTGLLGLLTFLWVVGHLLQTAWRGSLWRFEPFDFQLWLWFLSLLAGLMSLFVHGLIDFPYASYSVYLALWMMTGLVMRLGVLCLTSTNAYSSNRK